MQCRILHTQKHQGCNAFLLFSVCVCFFKVRLMCTEFINLFIKGIIFKCVYKKYAICINLITLLLIQFIREVTEFVLH